MYQYMCTYFWPWTAVYVYLGFFLPWTAYIPMGTPVTPKTPLSTQPPSRQRSEPYSGSSTGGGVNTPKVRPTVVTQPSLEEFEVIPPNPVFRDPPQPKNNKQATSMQVA